MTGVEAAFNATTGAPVPDLATVPSQSATKRHYFAQETSYRETWALIQDMAGRGANAAWSRHTYILFKPDAVVSHAVRKGLALLAECGFEALACAPLSITRHQLRELWRFDMNKVPVERLAAADLLFSAGEALVVLLRDPTGSGASERLRDLKGHAKSANRAPDQLRARLGAGDFLLDFVHSPDEPADMVRELGLLLTRRQLAHFVSVMTGAASAEPAEVVAMAGAMEGQVGHHPLDLSASLGRFAAAFGDRPRPEIARPTPAPLQAGAADWQEVLDALLQARTPSPLPQLERIHGLPERILALAAGDPRRRLWPDQDLELWDTVVIAAKLSQRDLGGVKSLLEEPLAVA